MKTVIINNYAIISNEKLNIFAQKKMRVFFFYSFVIYDNLHVYCTVY